jgi:hypothetical protein
MKLAVLFANKLPNIVKRKVVTVGTVFQVGSIARIYGLEKVMPVNLEFEDGTVGTPKMLVQF